MVIKMNFNFIRKNIGETTCLILNLDDDLVIDSFAIHMMAHNHIVNIVPVQIIQMDEKKYAQFDITGLTRLSDRVATVRPKKEVLSIFNSILNAFEEADVYMLDTERLFLQWEYIYLDKQGNCMLLYLPFAYDAGGDRIDFLREVVSRIKPDYQGKDPYLYDILNAFGRGAVQKLSDFRELIKKSANSSSDNHRKDREKENSEKQSIALQQTDGKEVGQKVQPKVQEDGQRGAFNVAEHKPDKKIAVSSKIPVLNIPGREPESKMAVPEQERKKKEQKNQRMKKNKTERKEEKRGLFKKSGESLKIPGIISKQKPDKILVPDKGNDILNPSSEILQPVDDHVDAGLQEMYEGYDATVFMQKPLEMEEDNKGTVLIQESDYSGRVQARLVQIQSGFTYWIRDDRMMIGSGSTADIHIDNQAISRSHAIIMRMEGQYYLEDNHSKNGSFVDGRRLQPSRKEAVYDGMVLKFANEEFVFYET